MNATNIAAVEALRTQATTLGLAAAAHTCTLALAGNTESVDAVVQVFFQGATIEALESLDCVRSDGSIARSIAL